MISHASQRMRKRLLDRMHVVNRQRRFRVHTEPTARFCEAVLEALDQHDWSLSVAFIPTREMESLNRAYRGREYATDVLSFSYRSGSDPSDRFLGEIVIAPEIAVRQAERYGGAPEAELRRLLVHGVLHLLGYDHETDRGEMMRLQGKLLRRKVLRLPPALATMDGDR